MIKKNDTFDQIVWKIWKIGKGKNKEKYSLNLVLVSISSNTLAKVVLSGLKWIFRVSIIYYGHKTKSFVSFFYFI